MRSLTVSRGASTANTLTYDEVAILFKVRSTLSYEDIHFHVMLLRLKIEHKLLCRTKMYVCGTALSGLRSRHGAVCRAAHGPARYAIMVPST